MISAKQVADILTLSRLVLALTLAWLGYIEGAAALPLACWLMIASWTTDVMDGWLKNTAGENSTLDRRTRSFFDISVSIGLFAYLLFSRLVPLWLESYILFWVLVFWRLGFSLFLGCCSGAHLWLVHRRCVIPGNQQWIIDASMDRPHCTCYLAALPTTSCARLSGKIKQCVTTKPGR
jgi:hypothetical protein